MSNISISDLPINSTPGLASLSSQELNLSGGFLGRLLKGIGRVAKVVAPIL